MSGFRIGRHEIGGDAPVFCVAELSANHGHDKDIALRTIEAAATAGANAIKLQTYKPETLTLRSNEPPFIVKTKNEWAGRTLWDLYADAMTPWEWHAELKAAAESVGLEFFSTPFDATAVAFLENLRVPAHKVASFELNDLTLVEAIARTGKPMIISTGMATLGDIEAALAVCREAGNQQIALLRCVSSYPARPAGMDLASFDVLKGFGTVVGLSDHTRDATVAIASVARGAKVIEKHFILDRSVGGPDAFFSLQPDEFATMVNAVRDTEQAIGRPRFGPAADEMASTVFRRSLFVARDVKAGKTLTCDDVRSVRPAHGLQPRHLPEVLGCVATRDLVAAKPLTWDSVGLRPPTTLKLRLVEMRDSELLLTWRNDPLTRAMSVNQQVIERVDHERWLAQSLESEKLILIAETDSPIGTVRLDVAAHGDCEVSLSVCSEQRRKGYAREMLQVAEEFARHRGVVRLTARIRNENEASIRAFKRAGFYSFTDDAPFVRCERRILRYR